jgi:hypothetical protein
MKSKNIYKVISCNSPFTQAHRVGWIGELASVESGSVKLITIDGSIIHAGVEDIKRLNEDEKDTIDFVANSADKRMLHTQRGY